MNPEFLPAKTALLLSYRELALPHSMAPISHVSSNPGGTASFLRYCATMVTALCRVVALLKSRVIEAHPL